MKSFTVAEISKLLNGELIGGYDKPIIGAEQMDRAKDQQLQFWAMGVKLEPVATWVKMWFWEMGLSFIPTLLFLMGLL